MRNIECRIASAVRGLADASTTPGGDLRECACCGAPTPTQSMCACWPHWMVLPEDLRSELLKSYGRDEFANYHRNILEAIETLAAARSVARFHLDGWRGAMGPRES